MANYQLQTVRLGTGTDDRDGRLVFIEDELVAVIVLLADDAHGAERGLWSLEADFRSFGIIGPLFQSPHDAVQWLLDGSVRNVSRA